MKKWILFCSLLLCTAILFGQHDRIDRLKQALAAATDEVSKVNYLDSLGDEYVFNDPDSTVKYSMQGLELARKINDENGEVQVLWNLAFGLSNLGNYTDALEYYYQDIALAGKLHDSSRLVWAYLALSDCYRNQSDFSNEFKSIGEARRWLRGNDPDLHTLYDRVISIYFVEINHPDSALIYAYRAMPLSTDWIYMNYVLGSAYEQLGKDSTSLSFFRKAITLSDTADHKNLIDYYNAISLLFWRQSRMDSAIYYAKMILGGGLNRYYPIGVMRASGLLAQIYETQKKTDSAFKYLKLTNTLKDSLFSQQKTRAAQSFAFNQQFREQELIRQKEQDASRLRWYGALASAGIILFVSGLLYRNNRQQKKAFKKLEKAQRQTERTLAELKKAQQQLIHSEKMASLGELTAGIAHEIQNPLNFVNNFSEVNQELIDELQEELRCGRLQTAIGISDDIRINEQKISQHGKRADGIIKGMLQHSRSGTGQKEPADINALADEYLRLCYHGLRAREKGFNVILETELGGTLPYATIVVQDIGRVLLNLFNNALYSMLQKVRKGGADYKPVLKLTTAMAGDWIEIRVRDNGSGIPIHVLEKIFNPFFTTKPAGEGTGLGLSLSYDIITKGHGGTIEAVTGEGVFAEFIIRLPVQP